MEQDFNVWQGIRPKGEKKFYPMDIEIRPEGKGSRIIVKIPREDGSVDIEELLSDDPTPEVCSTIESIIKKNLGIQEFSREEVEDVR